MHPPRLDAKEPVSEPHVECSPDAYGPCRFAVDLPRNAF